MGNTYKEKVYQILNSKYIVLACVLISCLFTIINGYPILYSDTSTYLASGFELDTPVSRPITYGILLRLFSLNGLSLVIVPVFQAIIFIYVLYQFLSLFINKNRIYFHLFCLITILAIFTGFFWSLNQLVADYYTPIGFLCLLIIFFRDRKPSQEIPIYSIFFISTASHLSSVFIYMLILVLLFLLRKKFVLQQNIKAFRVRAGISTGLIILSFLIMMSAFSKSKRVFYVGSLAEKGILNEILKDKCPVDNLQFCNYKDSIPASFEYFVWNPKSPLTQLGGWKACKEDLKKVISLSFSDSKYVFMQIKFTALFFLKQLCMLDIGEGNGSFDQSSVLIQRIQKYTFLDDQLCVSSKQHSGAFLELDVINLLYRVTALVSLLLLIWFIIYRRELFSPEIMVLIILTFVLIIANSFLTAYSSQISHRIGCKLIWLIFLIDFVLLATNNITDESS